MKVLVISGYWPTLANPISGIFVRQQVEAYAELGVNVTVVVPRGWPAAVGHRANSQLLETSTGLKVYELAYPQVPQRLGLGRYSVHTNIYSCGRAVHRAVIRKSFAGPFDAVHVHGVRYCGLSIDKWRDAVEGPALITLHGVDPALQALSQSDWFQRKLARLWAAVDRVVMVGNPLRSFAQRLSVPEAKLEVIPNGNALPPLPGVRNSQRQLYERRTVLSVSNLVQLKGIDLNLRALARLAHRDPSLGWQYRIVGDGVERARLECLAEELKVKDRVKFLGRLSYEQTMLEIEECDIFSMPSWGDAFGIVYLEAMARCRPVIGCKRWGAGEVVTDGLDGLLIEPKCVESLEAALENLLRQPELAAKMGILGRCKAEQFTWQTNAQRYLRLMTKLGARGTDAITVREDIASQSKPVFADASG